MRAAPAPTQASFYRTATGVEVDLVLELPGNRLWVMEVKRDQLPKSNPDHSKPWKTSNRSGLFLLYSGDDRYPKGHGVEAIGAREMAQELAALAK